MPSVEEFNRLADDAARQALLRCCSSGRWIDALLAGRPYPDVATLIAMSDAAVAELSEADLREAMAGHRRIGDRRVVARAGRRVGNAEPADWSGQEQAGVSGADDDLLRALADGNTAYEQRFGHLYLACATGRDAGELLALLRSRLANDRETEWGVVASELAKINQIRLRKLLDGEIVRRRAGGAPMSAVPEARR
jgi:2-oxo-4-hydroxy-4-carboxy-5-ureidoimidazoline decarboxylase